MAVPGLPPIGEASDLSTPQVLVALADEYLMVAHVYSSRVACKQHFKEYQQLVKAAIVCYETILHHQHLPPILECYVRYKQAKVLFEETTKFTEAEYILNKGIALADRKQLYNYAIAMRFLMCRILLQLNAKAASKYIDSCRELCLTNPAYSPWKDLTVFLHVMMEMSKDKTFCLSLLDKLCGQSRDTRLKYFARTLMVGLYLQLGQPQAAEKCFAQLDQLEAQLSGSAPLPSQLSAMNALYRVLSAVQLGNMAQAGERMKHLHNCMDTQPVDPRTQKWKGWTVSGVFSVQLEVSSDPAIPEGLAAPISVSVAWLNQVEVYILSYLISGVVELQNNLDKGKAARYLNEGLKMVSAELSPDHSSVAIQSFQGYRVRKARLQVLRFYINFYRCIVSFLSGNFSFDPLQQLMESCDGLPTELSPLFPFFTAKTLYLTALYLQSTGDLASAQDTYRKVREMEAAAAGTETDETARHAVEAKWGVSVPSADTRAFQPSELFLYSTLNLWSITEGELERLTQQESRFDSSEEKLSRIAELQAARNMYAGELAALYSEQGFTQNTTLQLAYALLNQVFNSSSFRDYQKFISFAQSQLKAIAKSSAQLTSIVLYLCSAGTDDMKMDNGEHLESLALAGYVNAKKAGDLVWMHMLGKVAADAMANNGKDLPASTQRGINHEIGKKLASRLHGARRN